MDVVIFTEVLELKNKLTVTRHSDCECKFLTQDPSSNIILTKQYNIN